MTGRQTELHGRFNVKVISFLVMVAAHFLQVEAIEPNMQCMFNDNGRVHLGYHGNQNVYITSVQLSESNENVYYQDVCVEHNTIGKDPVSSYTLYNVTCKRDDLDITTLNISKVAENDTTVCKFAKYKAFRFDADTVSKLKSTTATVTTTAAPKTTMVAKLTTAASSVITTTAQQLAVLQIVDSTGFNVEYVSTNQNVRLRVQARTFEEFDQVIVGRCSYSLLSKDDGQVFHVEEDIKFIHKGCSVQNENQLLKTNKDIFTNNGLLEVQSRSFNLMPLYDVDFSYMDITCEVFLCTSKEFCKVNCPAKRKGTYRIAKTARSATVSTMIYVKKKKLTSAPDLNKKNSKNVLIRKQSDLEKQSKEPKNVLTEYQPYLVLVTLVATVIALLLIAYIGYKFISSQKSGADNGTGDETDEKVAPSSFPNNKPTGYLGNNMVSGSEYPDYKQASGLRQPLITSPPPVYTSGSNLRQPAPHANHMDNVMPRYAQPVSPSTALSSTPFPNTSSYMTNYVMSPRSHLQQQQQRQQHRQQLRGGVSDMDQGWTNYGFTDEPSINLRSPIRSFTDRMADRVMSRGHDLPRRYQDSPSAVQFYPTPEPRKRLYSYDNKGMNEASIMNAAIKEYFQKHNMLTD